MTSSPRIPRSGVPGAGPRAALAEVDCNRRDVVDSEAQSGRLVGVMVTQPAIPAPPPWAASLFTVGVTGTNGKTTTTAWLAAALRSLSRPVGRATTVGFFLDEVRIATDKSYDGFIKGMRACFDQGGTHVAIELTSEALARGFARAWPCRVGVFTNLTHDHLDAHGTPEHYLASKAQLFVSLPAGGTAVLNASDENYELLREITPAGVIQRSYAVPARGTPQGEPDLVATSVDVGWSGTRITCAPRDIRERSAEGAPRSCDRIDLRRERARGAAGRGRGRRRPGRRRTRARRGGSASGALRGDPRAPVRRRRLRAHAQTRSRARSASRVRSRWARASSSSSAPAETVTEASAVRWERPHDSADVVLLTTDNPRDEDPADIAAAIARGLDGHRRPNELDREKAIATAILEAKDDDVVLVAGRGHETEKSSPVRRAISRTSRSRAQRSRGAADARRQVRYSRRTPAWRRRRRGGPSCSRRPSRAPPLGAPRPSSTARRASSEDDGGVPMPRPSERVDVSP